MVSSVVATLPGAPRLLQCKMQRMRQAELIDDLREARDDHGRRHFVVAGHRLGEGLGVLSPFPGGDSAGVDRLHPVSLGCPDQPGDDILRPLHLAGLEEVQHDFVVGHQDAATLVHDGRVAQLLVSVLGSQNRDGRFDDGRIAHAGVK